MVTLLERIKGTEKQLLKLYAIRDKKTYLSSDLTIYINGVGELKLSNETLIPDVLDSIIKCLEDSHKMNVKFLIDDTKKATDYLEGKVFNQ